MKEITPFEKLESVVQELTGQQVRYYGYTLPSSSLRVGFRATPDYQSPSLSLKFENMVGEILEFFELVTHKTVPDAAKFWPTIGHWIHEAPESTACLYLSEGKIDIENKLSFPMSSRKPLEFEIYATDDRQFKQWICDLERKGGVEYIFQAPGVHYTLKSINGHPFRLLISGSTGESVQHVRQGLQRAPKILDILEPHEQALYDFVAAANAKEE
jgi:hypothetical protein